MKTILFALSAVCVSLTPAFAQNADYWQTTSGPTYNGVYLNTNTPVATPNGSVFTLAKSEYSNVYGIFRTTDNGTSWTFINTPTVNDDSLFQNQPSNGIAMMGCDSAGTLFAVTSTYYTNYPDSIICSTNNGNSWHAIYAMSGSPLASLTTLLFTKSGTIYAGTSDDGLYSSTNSGNSWFDAGLGKINITCLATDGSGNIFAQATNGSSILFRSTDNGQNWTLVGSGLNGSITSIAHYGNILYACSGNVYSGGPVYSSTDTDATRNMCKFTSNTGQISINCLVIDGSGNIFLGTTGGVYESMDGGKTCTAINKGLTQSLQPPSVGFLAINTNDYLFAVVPDSGVYRSVNSTSTPYTMQNFWEYVCEPEYYTPHFTFINPNEGDDYNSLTSLTPSGSSGPVENLLIASDGSMLAIVDDQPDRQNELMRSTNNGISWYPDTNGLLDRIQVFDSTSNRFDMITLYPQITLLTLAPSGDIYIIAGNIFRSSDNGISWSTIPPPEGSSKINCLTVDNSGNIIIGSFNDASSFGIYRSTNQGGSWTQFTQGLPTGIWSTSSIAIDDKNEIFIAAGTIYRSTDNGNTFIADNYGIGSSATEMVVGDSGYLYVQDGSTFVYSTNDGIEWQPVGDLGSISINAFGINGFDKRELFVPSGARVWRTTDEAKSWVEADAGLDTAGSVLSFAFSTNGYVYAGTQNGIYRSVYQSNSDSGTTPMSVKENYTSSLIPSMLLLSAYPNPAQTNATLQFSLPQSSPVTLVVTDILGKNVATLENGALHSAGTYQVNFTTENLQPGVYFCNLRAGSLVKTMELMIAK